MPQSPAVRPFLIDTDPGVDDALAILMCLLPRATPAIELRALTVLGGNVRLAHTVRNACTLVDHAMRASSIAPPKVYAGTAQPLLGLAPDAAFVHGNDGFGDAQLPAPQTQVEPLHAALAIIAHANTTDGQLEILALGPLTNIALALALDPSLPTKVKRLIIMGGAVRAQGNITAFAEFNIAVDPEAAQLVVSRWPGVELVDWEACVRYAPSIAQTQAWCAHNGPNARLMHAISRKTLLFKHGLAQADGAITAADIDAAPWTWADPLAAYVALFPQRCEFSRAGIEVLREGSARGATLLNTRAASAHILTALDGADFHRELHAAMAG
jgi:purine nucleosidase